jgi:hypothetical protein
MMKRVVSLLLLLSLCVCYLTSCGGNFAATTTMAKAEKELTNNSYTVKMDMEYSCDDLVFDVIFDAFVKDIPAVVKGKNIYIDMSAETTGAERGVVFTLVDDILYTHSTYTEKPSKVKTLLKGDLLRDFMEDTRIVLPVTFQDFESVTMNTVNDKQVVTCAAFNADGAARMLRMISDPLALLEATATVKSLTMIATIAYDKYETVSLNAVFLVTDVAKGETHEVELSMNIHYTYVDVADIEPPSDSDNYTWVTYDAIMGG